MAWEFSGNNDYNYNLLTKISCFTWAFILHSQGVNDLVSRPFSEGWGANVLGGKICFGDSVLPVDNKKD